ncbi:PAS domain S-box protein [Verrucomicrobiota bacterium]
MPKDKCSKTIRLDLTSLTYDGEAEPKENEVKQEAEVPGGDVRETPPLETDTLCWELLQSLYDAVLICDLDGRIVQVNTRAAKYFGYDEQGLLELKLHDVIHGFYNHLLENLIESLKGERFTVIEGYCVRQDKSCILSEMAVSSIKLPDLFLGFFIRDITKREVLEDELANKEKLLRSLINSMPDHIYVKDKESRFLISNVYNARAMGLKDPEELVGKTDLDFHPKEFAKQYYEDEQEIIRNGQPMVNYEERTINQATGTEEWVLSTKIPFRDKDGNTAGIVGIGRNITVLKKTQKALDRSEEHYKVLFKNVLDGLLVMDTDKFNILFANQEAASIYGFSSEKELIGLNPIDLIPENHKSQTVRAIRESVVHKGKRFAEDFQSNTNDGREIWISALGTATDFENKPVILFAIRDISDRKKLEQDLRDAKACSSESLLELKRTQEQMVQRERLSALGQMASGVTHDFNNALMPILGFSDLLINTPEILDDKEEVKEIVRDIHSAAKDASGAVQQLREFYNPSRASKAVPLNVNRLLDTVVSLTQPRWKEEAGSKGLVLEMRKDYQEVPLVIGVESGLREALMNIILNAVDAMLESGVITLSTRLKDEWVVIEISDTGTGMTEEVRTRCFEPFYTTKDLSGSGMGLATTYGIITQRHSGIIDVKSDSGEGTTFVIRLPVAPPEEQGGDLADTKAEEVKMEPLRVLLVDDDRRILGIVSQYLTLENHKVEIAETGKGAISQFKKGDYDLVIIDRAMPDMSGDQVAVEIKSKDPGIPVIMLTGFGDVMVQEDDGDPDGVDLVLGKPVTKSELMKAIAVLLAGPHIA